MKRIVELAALLLILFLNSVCFSQKQDDIKIIVDAKFDIRKTSLEYFGNPDLWLYILEYNNIKNLSEVKTGSVLNIPQSKVKRMLSKLDEAGKSFQTAVQIGSKMLADELLSKASNLLQQSIKDKDALEFDSAEKSAEASITFSKAAYKQTKEIREKTIDAIISFKKGKVQKMFPSFLKWEEAELYDNLKENDWARTLTLSNANITFHDLSQIKLNENSQAIIQSSKFDVIDNKTTSKIKLEKGDAYALLLNSPKKKFDLEIKGVKTKINSKYFWVEKGTKSTKLSNYNGEISLEVKDSAVVVKKNQGSVIPDGGFPTTPQTLLSSPNLLSPFDLTKYAESKLEFSWTKNNRAESYWLEIASDATFRKVYRVYKNILDEKIEVASMDAGAFYWHVCSVDSTGLPGPYSESRIFIVKYDSNKPFLSIEYPSNNFVTRNSKIAVKGKVDSECNVTINQSKVAINSFGEFIKEIDLVDGKNVLVISASRRGSETRLARNVFCELIPTFNVTDKTIGELVDNMIIPSIQSAFRLSITTRPLSRIEIKSVSGSWSTINYSDTVGNCEFNLLPENKNQEYKMIVKTPAEFERLIRFTVMRTQLVPRILFEPELVSETNQESVTIQGRVENISELRINNQSVTIDADSRFETVQIVNKPINDFVFKSIGQDGSIITTEKRIIFDNQPPQLISFDVQKISKEETLYKITIKAEDNNSLKNYAEVMMNDNGVFRKELIKYSKEKNIYEGIISCGNNEKPKIKSIILEDLLTNIKTYEVSK